MLDWSCNVAAILLFAFACFGVDIGLVESVSARTSRLQEEQKDREAKSAVDRREKDIAEQKILDEAHRKAEAIADADKLRQARKSEMEAIEAAITKAEGFAKEERHKAAKELSERVRQFLKTHGETEDNLDWTGKIKSTRLRPLGH